MNETGPPITIHSAVCDECGGPVAVKVQQIAPHEYAVTCGACGSSLLLARTVQP